MKCEWDPDKYERNLQRHGLRFEVAELVFDDPYAVTFDERGDQRYQTLATYEGVLFQIAHIYVTRDGVEIPRIISFRRAVKNEQQKYYRRR